MSWTRGILAALAVCVVLVTGSVSCGTSGAKGHKDGQSVSPVGKVLDDTDQEGRHYREVDKDNAPEVAIEVQPATDDCWSVRLTVENFAFSPSNTKAKAVSGRGVAVLFVDDRPVTTLRTPTYRLAAAYVPQGTHKVTARLYADDGTVWAVDGDPVESTADVTASKPQPSTSTGSGTPGAESTAGGDGTGAESAPSAGDSGVRFAAITGGGASGPASTTTITGGSGSVTAPYTTVRGSGSGAAFIATITGGSGSPAAVITTTIGGTGSGTAPATTAGGTAPATTTDGTASATKLTAATDDAPTGTRLTATALADAPATRLAAIAGGGR
ncbi:hypothetical protein [Streptomyces sp. NPDC057253]|uniref:hypothetical protein n=1 Tax=Streptomyces sp. NPDC057253 TaxID=3346069 RepID=UPI00362BF7C9